MAPKDQELRPLMTRIPEKLRARLERAAAKAGRSMNAELIQRLEQSFEPSAQADLIQQIATAAVMATLDKLDIVPPHNNASPKTKGDKS